MNHKDLLESESGFVSFSKISEAEVGVATRLLSCAKKKRILCLHNMDNHQSII